MKGNGKRILSIFLAAVIAVTTVWYAPPQFTSSASWRTNMEKALELLASPSEASKQESTATPSEAESPGREATPSEAEIPDGKATPSHAVKKFVRVEPEEIPEYYSQVSASGKKFWKFEDRNGMVQYRDYGYVQGAAEFPLWYVTDLTGVVDDTYESVNLDEEYYSEAPYIYTPASTIENEDAWEELSNQLFGDIESIKYADKNESKPFKNWDKSTYTIWNIESSNKSLSENENDSEDNSENSTNYNEEYQENDLGYYFYGSISNENTEKTDTNGSNGVINQWYYADEDGNIWSMSNMIKAMLMSNLDTQLVQIRFNSGIEGTEEYVLDIPESNTNFSSLVPNSNIFSKVGYTLEDWSTTNDGSGSLLSNIGYNAKKSNGITYYAVWKPRRIGIRGYLNLPNGKPEVGGTIATGVDYGNPINNSGLLDFNESDLTSAYFISGYDYKLGDLTFLGWYTEQNGKGTKLNRGDIAYGTGENGDGNLNFYGYWRRNNYFVTYLTYDNKLITKQRVAVGQDAVPIAGPTRANNIFTGWQDAINLKNVTSDVSVTATYEKQKFYVDLYGNGGTADKESMISQGFNYGDNFDSYLYEYKYKFIRKGYTFDGWYQSVNGTTKQRETNNTMIYSKLDLYAHWYRSSYTVNYVDYAGDVVYSTQVAIGGASPKPPSDLVVSSQYGYEFNGWESVSKVNSDITLKAKYQAIRGPVLVEMDGGTFGPVNPPGDFTLTISHEATSEYLNNITKRDITAGSKKPGYTLKGYEYTTKNIRYSGFPQSIPIDFDLVIHLIWEEESYTVRYLNYDNTVLKTETVEYGQSTTAPILSPTRLGYEFIGWDRESLVNITQSIDIRAMYKLGVYIVVFKSYDGSNFKSEQVTYGNSATPPSNTGRVGYNFDSWIGDYIDVYSDRIINPKYRPIVYYIYYNGNGETSGNMAFNLPDYDQIQTLYNCDYKKSGYKFVGWNTKPNGSGAGYAAGQQVKNLTSIPGDRIDLYAQWERAAGAVTFLDYDGKVLQSQAVNYGSTATAPSNPTRTGYAFNGWDNPSLLINIQGDVVVTATYVKNKYSVTFIGNGGLVGGESSKSIAVEYQSSLDSFMSEYKHLTTRVGYEFNGWYTDSVSGTKYSESDNIMGVGNISIYAHWIRNEYKVSYVDYNGNILKTENVEYGNNSTPPEVNPIRDGYTFKGWDKTSTNIQDHTTITAQYTANLFTLTLDGNGGTVAGDETKSQTISFGESIDQALEDGAAKASRKYYTFDGWYTESTGGSKYTGSGNTMPASSVTVYAHWVRKSSEVVYKDWNGDVLKTQEVAIGADATPPSDPLRAGYAFTGWDKTSTNIQNHTTITAQYKANLFTLTLDGNGGTVAGDENKSQTISFGESIDQALEDGAAKTTRKYYTFDGWYTMPNGGSKYTGSGNTMPASSLTVYAHWVRKSSEVVYKDWNGDVLKTQEVAIGADATPPSDPARAGYDFTGWDKTSTNIQNHTTITAQYKANLFTLTLDGNGGAIAGKETLSQTISFGESIDQALEDGATKTSRKYYTFDGWYTMPTGGSKYTGSGNTMPTSSLTVYAHWVRKSSEVVYKDWNGDVLKTQEVAIGADTTPPSDPLRAGYDFTGWDKASTNIQDHTTITAQYTANHLMLTLDGNGGTIAGKETLSQTISFGESIDQELTDEAAQASRKYYTFDGWYTESTGGNKYAVSGNTMPASSVTVYAHWVRNSSEVVYKDWNGDVLKTQEVAIGADATPPSDPVRSGYAFTGWDKASTNIQNHTTITAQYTANHLMLTLGGNGGTIAGKETLSQTISFGESIDQELTDEAAQASRKYYTFDGWYTESTGGNKYAVSGNTMPASSVTVYAHWVRNSSEVVYKDWNGDVLKTQEVAIGADATPPSDPVRSGYAFTEWDKPSTNILNHTTITAQYKANLFALTLDGNGGTIAGEETKSQTISFGESIDQELTDGAAQASRKYYTFDGWYTMPTGGSKYTGSGNAMPASSVTVYAHWVRKSSVVVYKDWNGQVLKTQEVAIGADATPPEDPVRTGYAFAGWDKPSINIQSNTTITAIYSADDYKQTSDDKSNVAPVLVPPTIDTTTKPTVPDSGGKFIVNPENPYDVTYTKPYGTPAKDEWVGDGREWYHVDEKGKINYDWYLEGEKTWYKFNQEKGDRLGAALIGWNHEPMDDKRYFFDPTTTKMLTGWQNIDGKSYYFTTNNEGQTYFGSNLQGGSGWKYDPNRPGKPYGSMYRNEYTPDGYWVDENGVCADKK